MRRRPNASLQRTREISEEKRNKLFLLRNWVIKEDLDVLVATEPKIRVVLRPLVSEYFAAGSCFTTHSSLLMVCICRLPFLRVYRLFGAWQFPPGNSSMLTNTATV